MLMDISCPTEFRKLEQVHFSDGRRLAYLTFLNESDETIIAVSGRLTMMDANGYVIERRHVSFKNLQVEPREAYVCNLVLDEYPMFEQAYMAIESISFLMRDTWAMDPGQFINCKPPALPPGPERVALVSIAGADAVCFPEQREQYWICVCGRFNKKEWNVCCRCSRMRQKVFREYTKGAVIEAYRERLEKKHKSGGRKQVMMASAYVADKNAPTPLQEKKDRMERRERSLLIGTITVLVVSLLLWGILRHSQKKMETPSSVTGINTAQRGNAVPEVDYLEPVTYEP